MHQQLPSIGPIHAQHAVSDTPSQRDLAEDLAWARLYRVVHQPSAAAEVVKYMDSNPEAKSRNEALYLLARQTLHTKALADEQNERTVAFFRAIFVNAPIGALRLVKSLFIGIHKVFSRPEPDSQAIQPKVRVSKAKARIDVLGKVPEVAQTLTGFAPSSPAVVPEAQPVDPAQASRSSKAA